MTKDRQRACLLSDYMSDERESKLSHHKRTKKQLTPPLLTLGMSTSSWINDRMPEMLWAVLVVGNVERKTALEFFRAIAKFVQDNPSCWDVTLTGIYKFPPEKTTEFIKAAVTWSDEVRKALRPLTWYEDLPAREHWREFLADAIETEDLDKLANGVSKTYWHQSEEATDCRWIKYLCEILSGKLKFAKIIDGIEDTLRGVYEYPNFGDLTRIRGFIRTGEMASVIRNDNQLSEWSKKFWQQNFDRTTCLPQQSVSEKTQLRENELYEGMKESRQHYFNSARDIRLKLIEHLLKSSTTSAIDSRHEIAFGLVLYSFSLYLEIIFYSVSLSITGRLAMRSLIECYITLKYLLQKETSEPEIWDTFREYGNGQLKLLYLKLREMKQEINSIESETLNELANEDKWIEFTPINLGHWDSENLRKISEDVGLKNLYDKYYSYTSGFTHGTWGAIRESIYQKCVNPLHRLHRIPIFDLPLMPSVLEDMREIMNNILETLSIVYPKFEDRLTKPNNNNTPIENMPTPNLLKPIDFGEGIQQCIKNAERYINSGKTLKATDRQTAYLLFMYALEEMGKVPLIFNGLFYSATKTKWQKWLRKFKDHGEKFWYSKDLDDFSEGKLADKQNAVEIKMASKKLEVAYVDLIDNEFKPPADVTEEDMIKIESDCEKRISLLKRNHLSAESDAKLMEEGYERLKDMTEDQLREVAEKIVEENKLRSDTREDSLKS